MSYPCLYDVKNKEYKNLNSKKILWSKIGIALGQTPEDVGKRFDNLLQLSKFIKIIK